MFTFNMLLSLVAPEGAGIYIYIWLTAVGSGGTTLGGELCRFLDLVGHGAKFDQTESCGSSVERGPG